jgi:gliding motility-associated-like protein
VIDLADSISACFGLPVILDAGYSVNSLHYLWSTGDTLRTSTGTAPGLYWVKVFTEYCEAYDTLVITECVQLVIPNLFSPNGDGFNETFHPGGDLIPGYELYIFNRWGNLIFTTNDFYAGWDGTYNNQACAEGVYFYIIYFNSTNVAISQKEMRKGTVTLVR